MTAYAAHVEVSHRPGIADPAGATVERALPALGYTNVSEVKIGKTIRLVVDAPDAEAARQQVKEMCERLLANPVIESRCGSTNTCAPIPKTKPPIIAPPRRRNCFCRDAPIVDSAVMMQVATAVLRPGQSTAVYATYASNVASPPRMANFK